MRRQSTQNSNVLVKIAIHWRVVTNITDIHNGSDCGRLRPTVEEEHQPWTVTDPVS